MSSQFEKNKVILIVGLFFVIGGSSLLVAFFSPLETYSFLIFPTVVIVLGITMLYQNLTGKKHTYFTFIGLFLCSNWLLLLLVNSHIIPYSIGELWPIMIMLSALVLIPLGFIRYGFLPISFVVSGCMLFGFGIVFLLFSLDIISMSITTFAKRWWPMIFVVFGILLICLFFYSQKHKREEWVKNSDDYEDLS